MAESQLQDKQQDSHPETSRNTQVSVHSQSISEIDKRAYYRLSQIVSQTHFTVWHQAMQHFMRSDLLPQEYKGRNQHAHKREITERRNNRFHRRQHTFIYQQIGQRQIQVIKRYKANGTDQKRPQPESTVFCQVNEQLPASQ